MRFTLPKGQDAIPIERQAVPESIGVEFDYQALGSVPRSAVPELVAAQSPHKTNIAPHIKRPARADWIWNGANGTAFWADPKERLVVVYGTVAPGEIRKYYREHVGALVYGAKQDLPMASK